MIKKCLWFSTIETLLLSMSLHAAPATNATLSLRVQVQGIISANTLGSKIASAEATYISAQADLILRAENLKHTTFDWGRDQRLLKEALIAKQDYDLCEAAEDNAVAGLASAEKRTRQAKAHLENRFYKISKYQTTQNHRSVFLVSSFGRTPITVMRTIPNTISVVDFPDQAKSCFKMAKLETLIFTID